jgi:hypothetical protein
MTTIDTDIAEVEAVLRHLKKLRKAAHPSPMKGRHHSPEVRAKMSAARKAAWADPAVRAKMSAARKAAWADPAVRAKMSAARKAAWADPAVRAKMSAARKAAWAEKHEADMRPRQKHEKRAVDALREVPHDALEVALFGGRR